MIVCDGQPILSKGFERNKEMLGVFHVDYGMLLMEQWDLEEREADCKKREDQPKGTGQTF